MSNSVRTESSACSNFSFTLIPVVGAASQFDIFCGPDMNRANWLGTCSLFGHEEQVGLCTDKRRPSQLSLTFSNPLRVVPAVWGWLASAAHAIGA